jgi:hypothetical protein
LEAAVLDRERESMLEVPRVFEDAFDGGMA